MHTISIMAAMGKNRELGLKNDLPWDIPADRARLKQITSGHTVIMGRRTFDSINNLPLPDRKNIVMTRQRNRLWQGVSVVHSREEALEAAATDEEVFVLGGAGIYEQFLPCTSRMYLTVIHKTYDADVWFPSFEWSEWDTIQRTDIHDDSMAGAAYGFYLLERTKQECDAGGGGIQ